MRISTGIDIDAPAAAVWEVIGPQFGDVGRWARAVQASTAVGEVGEAGSGRRCDVSAPGFDAVTEELLTYDEQARSLSYLASAGMPRFVRSATNAWRVRPRPGGGSRFDMQAHLELTGTARLLTPGLAAYLWGVGRLTARDLQVYVETGRPRRGGLGRGLLDLVSPSSRPSLRRLVGVNGAFSASCGALLVLAPGWWSTQLSDVPSAVVVGIGLSLLGYGAGLLGLVRRGPVPAGLGRALAGLDAAWVLATAVLLLMTWSTTTTAGVGALLGTASVVAVLGASQWAAAGTRPRPGAVVCATAQRHRAPLS